MSLGECSAFSSPGFKGVAEALKVTLLTLENLAQGIPVTGSALAGSCTPGWGVDTFLASVLVKQEKERIRRPAP